MADVLQMSADTGLSTGDLAYERIRSDIVFGLLKPAQRLTLDQLKTRYGVGVGTLREILSALVPQGLVTAEGQRGFQVAACSLPDLRDIAELRLLLETHALERSFAAGDMEWEGRIVAAGHKLSRIEERLLAGDSVPLTQWKRYDFEFHKALVSACGSQALLALHATVYDRYLRYQMVFGVFRGSIAAEEHRGLLASAMSRDSAGALAILDRHIRSCIDVIAALNP